MKRYQLLIISVITVFIMPIALIVIGVLLSDLHAVKFELRQKSPLGWSMKDVAIKYAPILCQELPKNIDTPWYWDAFCSTDFDGDWDTKNNLTHMEESKDGSQLKPGIYYSVLETKTYFIITYSIFHPLEWSCENQALTKWYENDLKNVQVVVNKISQDKPDGEVWLVALQRRSGIDFHKSSAAKIKETAMKFQPENVVLAGEDGSFALDGTHPVLVIGSGRHNLYLPRQRLELFSDLEKLEFAGGIMYLPGTVDILEATPPSNGSKRHYGLLDTYERLWNPLLASNREREMVVHPSFAYEDEQLVSQKIPLFLVGTDLAGKKSPLPNPNILPFAFGRGVENSDPGTFFFNPAKAYKHYFNLYNWSSSYLYHPYVTDMLK